jgi:hypothetical protein
LVRGPLKKVLALAITVIIQGKFPLIINIQMAGRALVWLLVFYVIKGVLKIL